MPAAGPLTLVCEPLSHATSRPPTTPLTMPANIGAPEARAMPRHKGSATRKTTNPAARSLGREFPLTAGAETAGEGAGESDMGYGR